MHEGLLSLGMVLLFAGLLAVFHYESTAIFGIIMEYRSIGIVLVMIGGFLAVVGVLYPSRKEEISEQSI